MMLQNPFLFKSIYKLTEKEYHLCDEYNQFLVSQNIVKDNNELCDKTDQLQMYEIF